MEGVGERLKAIRNQKGLSLRKLAKQAKTSHSFIADIESGRSNPSLATLAALAEALGVPVSELMGETEAGPTIAPDRPATTPDWWYRDTPPTRVELEELLRNSDVHFHGAPLNEEDKEEILDYLAWKWERDRMRREKEGRENG